MEKEKIEHFKQMLLEEQKTLRGELESVGRVNPDNPQDWEPRPTNTDFLPADKNEVADNMVDYEDNAGILKQLEIRWNNIKNALEKIEKGTYGKCEVSGEMIDEKRLEANPAARTCMEHMNQITE